jgi:hypothetical protein
MPDPLWGWGSVPPDPLWGWTIIVVTVPPATTKNKLILESDAPTKWIMDFDADTKLILEPFEIAPPQFGQAAKTYILIGARTEPYELRGTCR